MEHKDKLDSLINAYEFIADTSLDRSTLKFLKELREYKKAEEQGLLLKLPCKVDDTAYYVHREYCDRTKKWTNHIDEVIVDSFVLNINLFVNVSLYIGGDRFGKTLTPYKTLFFTKEQAEQALEEMEGGHR